MSIDRTGADLLEAAREAFDRYTIQTAGHVYDALALYVAYTHGAEAFHYAPRLLLTSAEKRSGKTRTMEIAICLSRDPLVAANATVPAIFRSIGDRHRTLFFDEADTIFGTKIKAEMNEDLRGLINAGFQRGTPVLRTVGPQHVPTEFETFSPVVMAAIGNLPDTIVDRAVNVRLRRRKPTETVSPFRASRHEAPLLDLREALAEWIGQHLDELRDAEPETPLEDRAADLWEPLLAVADLAGGTWPARARSAAVAMTREAAEGDSESSEGMELLRDASSILTMIKSDFIPTKVLLEHLRNIEDSRWLEDNLTGRRLSMLLAPYGIVPRSNGSVRGYPRARFNDAFERYLSPSLPIDVSEVSEPSETPPASQKVDTGEPSGNRQPSVSTDGSDTSLTLSANDGNSEIPGQLTDLTGLTDEPTETGEICPCGTELKPFYVQTGRRACPGHEHLLEAAQ